MVRSQAGSSGNETGLRIRSKSVIKIRPSTERGNRRDAAAGLARKPVKVEDRVTKREKARVTLSRRLLEFSTELKQRSGEFNITPGLVFLVPPEHDSPLPSRARSMEWNDVEATSMTLRFERSNDAFLDYERWLMSAHKAVNAHFEEDAKALARKFEEEFSRLQALKLEDWISQQKSLQLEQDMREMLIRLKKPPDVNTVDTCTYSDCPSRHII